MPSSKQQFDLIIIGSGSAGEMIHEIVAAMKAHALVSAIAEMIYAYPTFAEGIEVAACDWLEKRA